MARKSASSPQDDMPARSDKILSMKPADIRAYAERDWNAVRDLKERYWAEAKKDLTPEQALAIGDDLRRHVQTLRPDWPDAEQHRADLAVHAHVSTLLRRVPSPTSR